MNKRELSILERAHRWSMVINNMGSGLRETLKSLDKKGFIRYGRRVCTITVEGKAYIDASPLERAVIDARGLDG